MGMLSFEEVCKRLDECRKDEHLLGELYDRGKALNAESLDQIKGVESKASTAVGYGLGIATFLVSSLSSWSSKGNQTTFIVAGLAATAAFMAVVHAVGALRLQSLKAHSPSDWLQKDSLGSLEKLRAFRIIECWGIWQHRIGLQRQKAQSVLKAQIWLSGAAAYLAIMVLQIGTLQLFLRWIAGAVDVEILGLGVARCLRLCGSWSCGLLCIGVLILLVVRSRRV